jgi:hypothetical protein
MAIPPISSERAMTIHRNIVSIAGLAAVLLGAGIGPAAAELEDCFRDGYLCAVACDRAGGGSSAVARCESRCNDEEKVCIGKAAQAQPAYSPAIPSMKIRWPGTSPMAAR